MKDNVPDFRSDQTPHYSNRAQATRWFLSLLVGGLVIILTFVHLDTIHSVSYAARTTPQLGAYVGAGDGSLYKLDASNGVLQWRFQTQGKEIPAPATVTNGVVYFGSTDGNVYAVSADNGKEVWHFATGASVLASPAVDNGVVYVGSSDSNLYALDATDGNKLWSYHTGQSNETVTPTTAVVLNGVLYSSSSDEISHSYLFALDAKTGAQLWRIQVNDQLFTKPQVVNGVIYIASSALSQTGGPSITDSYVYAFDIKDGSLHWQSQKISDFISSAPAVAGGVVFFGSRNDNLYALNADSGTEVWHHKANGAIFASPQVDNGVVYIGTSSGMINGNSIMALNAKDGSLRWQHAITNYAGANIVVNNNVLYAGASDSMVYALKIKDGSQIWSHKDAAPFTNAPLTVA